MQEARRRRVILGFVRTIPLPYYVLFGTHSKRSNETAAEQLDIF
jgi:hypothetical protein